MLVFGVRLLSTGQSGKTYIKDLAFELRKTSIKSLEDQGKSVLGKEAMRGISCLLL